MKSRTPHPIVLAGAVLLLCAAAALLPPGLPAQSETGEEESGASDAYLIAKGAVTYRVYCASCHGPKGLGDGTLAELLKVPPANLTQLAANNEGVFPREEVHATIDGRGDVKGHGTRDMPVWGEAFKKTLRTTWREISDEERAQLKIVEVVYYLQSIQE